MKTKWGETILPGTKFKDKAYTLFIRRFLPYDNNSAAVWATDSNGLVSSELAERMYYCYKNAMPKDD